MTKDRARDRAQRSHPRLQSSSSPAHHTDLVESLGSTGLGSCSLGSTVPGEDGAKLLLMSW